MLVLSRKNGERIHIGDDIFIEVRRVAGSRVTLAVNAPRNLRVLRGELLEAAKSFEEAPAPNAEPRAETPQSETIIVSHDSIATNDNYPGPHAVS